MLFLLILPSEKQSWFEAENIIKMAVSLKTPILFKQQLWTDTFMQQHSLKPVMLEASGRKKNYNYQVRNIKFYNKGRKCGLWRILANFC